MLHLQESGEMYLETIFLLCKTKGAVRSVDVCEHMGYSKPSVSRAVNLLKQGGYLTVEDTGNLRLTEEGLQVAQKIYSRHQLLTHMLVSLGVDPQTAGEDACKMEHVISDETFDALYKHLRHNPQE